LRTLLLFMLVLSVGLGWFTARLRNAKRQVIAVAAIREIGGSVKYDYERSPTGDGFSRWAQPSTPAGLRKLLGEDFFRNVVLVDFCRRQLEDEDLAALRYLPQLECLSIDGGQITDDGLRHLAGLTSLEFLTLGNVDITDAGLEHLQGLTRLESLNLFGTAVTGSGLEYLRNLPRLRKLNLAYTNLADDGLCCLPDCHSLEDVRLRGANISDAALGYLAGLTQLKRVDLTATKVSQAGVEDFRLALPHVKVSW
jgi:internalin A